MSRGSGYHHSKLAFAWGPLLARNIHCTGREPDVMQAVQRLFWNLLCPSRVLIHGKLVLDSSAGGSCFACDLKPFIITSCEFLWFYEQQMERREVLAHTGMFVSHCQGQQSLIKGAQEGLDHWMVLSPSSFLETEGMTLPRATGRVCLQQRRMAVGLVCESVD